MAVAVIADAHIGGPGGAPDALVEQLRELPRQGCERLVLLGDLFHLWVGDDRYQPPEAPLLLPHLRRLCDQGVRIDYIEGNRDFYVEHSGYADAFATVGLELAFAVDGVRYLAVHGDGLNPRDWRYRSWRRLSKNPVTRSLYRYLPPGVARSFSLATDRQFEKGNLEHKIIPERALLRYARRRLAEGHDVVLLGHFHQRRTWQLEGGELRIVEAWAESRRVEWIPAPPPAQA